MKSIKKISILAVAAILSMGIANAQVGLQAGYNKSFNTSANSTLDGFHVGPTYNMTIQGPVSLQYGLLYNYLTKSEGSNITLKTTAHRVDVPVRLAAGFPLGNTVKLYVFGGPNFDFGIAQSISGDLNIGGTDIGGEIKNIYENKDYSRFDLQMGAGAGVQFGKLGVRVSYDWGMLDRYKPETSEWKNNDLKASLVFSF